MRVENCRKMLLLIARPSCISDDTNLLNLACILASICMESRRKRDTLPVSSLLDEKFRGLNARDPGGQMGVGFGKPAS